MKVTMAAIGRLKSGPERDLLDDYITRFDRTGRPLGLGPLIEQGLDNRKAQGMAAEADLLRGAIPEGAKVIALDERGSLMSSPKFSQKLAGWRDEGVRDVVFLIGGADGLDPSLRAGLNGGGALSFGKMVWPHMLVRVMLAEQLYRAASILAGSPYHRN
ncbi:23S rRNA (pseudouridine(1915)-N(3))-methyltransferase RlmH [Paracoccaceae bacterium GXU_MW_L88]